LTETSISMSDDDQHFMTLAIEQAQEAAKMGEVPVGAVVVHEGRVIGRGHNRKETANDPTAHAEILALREAAARIRSWRLCDATLYVTLEPCPMCAGALVNARIQRLVYGCEDPKAGAVHSLFSLCEDPRLNHRIQVVRGVKAETCTALLKDFFTRLRAEGDLS
jgi:tRNA(adenine34) deaminase